MSTFRFCDFELLTSERRLLCAGQPCAIGSRAFDLLLALVERRDRVVSKNELLELAWPGLVVEENNLSVQISGLRKLLGADAIATVTGRGYRFSLPCSGLADSGLPTAPPALKRLSRRLVALVYADLDMTPQAQDLHSDPLPLAWSAARGEFIEPSLAAFAGHAIEITAERTVLAFASAVDAVAWCLDVQERLMHLELRDLSRRLPLRMVVSVEEAVFDQGKMVGDPFLAAQALRHSARGGQVCVTATVRALVRQRIAAEFIPLRDASAGAHGSTATQLWQVQPDPLGASPVSVPSPRLAWNHRPTLAVLPFDAGQGSADAYFGEGITEEIITALSLNRSFFVVARGSTLGFGNAAQAVERAGLQLGVRYVIHGHVRRQGHRLRIHAQLTDVSVDRVIWSEHFDGEDVDLFRFQAQMAARISAAIDPCVQQAEIERLRLRPTDNFSAYDCVLRGLALQFQSGHGDFESAGSFFRQAIELDQDYARAHAYLARWHSLRAGDGRCSSMDGDRARAEHHAQRAIALDPRDAWNLAIAGHIQSFLRKRFTLAMDLFDHALQINPNCALAWARSGTTLAYLCRGEEGLDRVRNAMRLSPLDQHAFFFCTTTGLAALTLGRHDEAVAWLSRARRLNPAYRAPMRLLVAAHSLAGEAGEARELAQEFLAQEPSFRVSEFAAWYPLQRPCLDTLLRGLRDAGLPE